ncbi:MAG: DUF393 domain-containing protein [Chthonomonadaceae bacterium]|nr:DUF393 domain-containing protein [Chthonomonadaceae bacterium]
MTWKLFYDGECNLCHGSQLQVVRWAARAKQPIETDVLQSANAREQGFDGDAMVLVADQTYFGHNAWLCLMRVAPWYLRWIGYVGSLPGVNVLAKAGYGIVAKYRKKWFGQRACPLPEPKSKVE